MGGAVVGVGGIRGGVVGRGWWRRVARGDGAAGVVVGWDGHGYGDGDGGLREGGGYGDGETHAVGWGAYVVPKRCEEKGSIRGS